MPSHFTGDRWIYPSINFFLRVEDGCITVCVKRFLQSDQNENDFEILWLFLI